jgi:SAM-dependent methyltransferase
MEQAGTGVAPDAIAPKVEGLYYRGGYWNEIPSVRAEIRRRISGRRDAPFRPIFHGLEDGRRFGRALFLNCGDGHVEREFLERGIIESGVGIDISEELLATAREAGAGLPLRYVRTDVNQGVLPDEHYDLIVNNAGGHHVAFVDRVFRAFCRVLAPDGLLVNYDYVGPHRNQYPWQQWEALWRLNESLPEGARQKLVYAHLPTMIALDPSEAVHSELLLEASARYFTTDEFKPTGGALAYTLLTFNEALKSLPERDAQPAIDRIMDADGEYLRAHPDSTLFAYWRGTPKPDVLRDAATLARWEAEENEREARAAANGGRYYPKTLLEALLFEPGGTGAQR